MLANLEPAVVVLEVALLGALLPRESPGGLLGPEVGDVAAQRVYRGRGGGGEQRCQRSTREHLGQFGRS